MTKKKRRSAPEESEWRHRIKKLVVIAMFSDDTLMDRWVLKGGNAIDLIHNVGARASVDIDLSMDGEFEDEELSTVRDRVKKALGDTFLPEGLQVFDVTLEERPKELTDDIRDFWGGYAIEFKLIEAERYEELKESVDSLRRNAVQLGAGSKFLVDISKHEYVRGKASFDLDGFTILAYTPEMIVCEKLRAICQQMREYGPVVRRARAGSPRARDFIDIQLLVSKRKVDLREGRNRRLLTEVFACKRVNLSLLRKIDHYREFHRIDYPAVAATVKPGVTLREFDYYVDFVVGEVRKLEPLGDE